MLNTLIIEFMMDYGEAMMIPGQTDTKVRSANDHNIIGEDSKSGPQQPTGFNLMLIQASTALTKFLESWFGIVNAHHYFFLALLGIITATVCFCTDLCTVYLIDRNHYFPITKTILIVKLQIVRNENIGYHTRYLIYVVCVVVCMMIAVSMS